MDFSIAAPPLRPSGPALQHAASPLRPDLLLALALSALAGTCLAGPTDDIRLLLSRGDLPGALSAADRSLQVAAR
jgi:hypothetical protein